MNQEYENDVINKKDNNNLPKSIKKKNKLDKKNKENKKTNKINIKKSKKKILKNKKIENKSDKRLQEILKVIKEKLDQYHKNDRLKDLLKENIIQRNKSTNDETEKYSKASILNNVNKIILENNKLFNLLGLSQDNYNYVLKYLENNWNFFNDNKKFSSDSFEKDVNDSIISSNERKLLEESNEKMKNDVLKNNYLYDTIFNKLASKNDKNVELYKFVLDEHFNENSNNYKEKLFEEMEDKLLNKNGNEKCTRDKTLIHQCLNEEEISNEIQKLYHLIYNNEEKINQENTKQENTEKSLEKTEKTKEIEPKEDNDVNGSNDGLNNRDIVGSIDDVNFMNANVAPKNIPNTEKNNISQKLFKIFKN